MPYKLIRLAEFDSRPPIFETHIERIEAQVESELAARTLVNMHLQVCEPGTVAATIRKRVRGMGWSVIILIRKDLI